MRAEPQGFPRKASPIRWVFLPVRLAWRAVSLLERKVGLMPTLLVGLTLFVVGIVLNMTWIGMLIGIPATLLGSLFLLRALY